MRPWIGDEAVEQSQAATERLDVVAPTRLRTLQGHRTSLRLRFQVRARDGLGDHGRLGLTLDLDGDLGHLLDDVRLHLVYAQQLLARPNAFADMNGIDEPNSVETVVDAHAAGQPNLDALAAAHDEGRRRQGPEAMGDGAAEGSGLGPLGIDVDPLMVAGGIGEGVDLLLSDRMPVAYAGFFADVLLELFDAGDGSVCHKRAILRGESHLRYVQCGWVYWAATGGQHGRNL